MVYSNKFVLSVLVNGHPQSELSNGVVPLPFDAEYVLRFRNKNNRRAVVKFTIDGENVSGNGYIIDANSHLDIKRHRDVDRAFKFVSLESEDAIDFGKNGPNEDKVKGTIEARFYLEKERQATPTYVPYPVPCIAPYPAPHPYPVWPRPYYQNPIHWLNERTVTSDSVGGCCGSSMSNSVGGSSYQEISKGISGGPSGNSMRTGREVSNNSSLPLRSRNAQPTVSLNAYAPPLQDGCTVEGSMTGQGFTTKYIDIEDNCTILRVFLQGKHVDTPVVEQKPAKAKKEDPAITDLEAENESLRKELAEEENRLLKQKLANLKKPIKKTIANKKPIKKA